MIKQTDICFINPHYKEEICYESEFSQSTIKYLKKA